MVKSAIFYRNILLISKPYKVLKLRIVFIPLIDEYFPWNSSKQYSCSFTYSRLYQINIIYAIFFGKLLDLIDSAAFKPEIILFWIFIKIFLNLFNEMV